MIHIRKGIPTHPHGPENAEHEIKKAYYEVIDSSATHFWDRRSIAGVNPYETITLYRRAYDAYRGDDRLSAERWARTAKHLARAFGLEAKIAYMEPRATELPFLENAYEEYGLIEHSDTTADLINSVADHIPPGLDEMPEDMRRYVSRSRKHLGLLEQAGYKNELLRALRIQAAHEYGRVVECLALAYEAENRKKKVA